MGKHFLTSFKINGEEHKRRRLLSSEHVFFLIMLYFSSSETLGCTPWVAFPTQVHPKESLGSWRGGRFVCHPSLTAVTKSWGHCGLCVTRQESPHLKFRSFLHVCSVPAVLGLHIGYTNNLSFLSCPWGNPALSPVLTVTGWQDASSELSLAFLCLHKTSAAVCPCWEMFYTWRAHSWFFQWFTVLLDMLSCEICYLLEVTLTAGFRVWSSLVKQI